MGNSKICFKLIFSYVSSESFCAFSETMNNSPGQPQAAANRANPERPEQADEIQQMYINAYKLIFEDYQPAKAYAVFAHGTIVLFEEVITNNEEVEQKAVEAMNRYGPVMPGSPAADFNVVSVQAKFGGGWMVTSWNKNIYTLVLPDSKDELKVEDNADDLVVGLQGRGKRHLDSQELKVIHVEIK